MSAFSVVENFKVDKNILFFKKERYILALEDRLLFQGMVIADMLTGKWTPSKRTIRHIVEFVNCGAGFHILIEREITRAFLRLTAKKYKKED